MSASGLANIPVPDMARYRPLRDEVRRFIDTHRGDGWLNGWDGFDPALSRQLGARGWLGMTWPKAYGGHEQSNLARYVVIEELLAAGAPLSAHWVADRQTGPLLLALGTEAQKQAFLPRIARGECYFAIGMSEPDSGSDLASVRTRGRKVDGGWRVTGTKLWSSYALYCTAMIALIRTSDRTEDRRGGLTQVLVDLAAPGVTVRGIANLAGEVHFSEVHFDDYFVPDEMVVGAVGDGWAQVTRELVFERSGPDRFLSDARLFLDLVDSVGSGAAHSTYAAIGRIAAHLATLRSMSLRIAAMLEAGRKPEIEASIVKNLGVTLEQEIPEVARALIADEGIAPGPVMRALLEFSVLHAPSFSIRGGTREILRGVIARGLGLR